MYSIIFFLLLVLSACGTSPSNHSLATKIHPIDEFDIKSYEQYATTLQIRNGYSKEEASKFSFEIELLKVALINKAIELGTIVTDEEAKKRANEGRELFEAGKLSDAEIESIKQTILELGITEEQFWSEYAVQTGAKMEIMVEAVHDYHQQYYPEMDWDDFTKEIVENYKRKEPEKIAIFKKQIGLE